MHVLRAMHVSCSITSGFCLHRCFQLSHNGMNVRSNESAWKNGMDEKTIAGAVTFFNYFPMNSRA
jgi:hypothetical protein